MGVLLQHDAMRKMHALKNRYHLKEYSICRKTDCFLMTFYGAIYGRDVAFSGIVSEDPAAFKVYSEYMREKLETVKLLIVTEQSQEKAECIAEWTDRITPSGVRVLYTVYGRPEIYDRVTGIELIYEEDFRDVLV